MASPNTRARHHGQGTPGSRSSPRFKKLPPKNYAPTAVAFPITSGGTTAIAKGGHTPPDHVGGTLVRSLSFATPLAVPASNSVSSLSQSTKETSKISAGKRDGPSIVQSSEKRMKSNPSSSFDSEARKNNASFDDGHNDKEADFVPITDKASNTIMDGKNWEEDYGITERHRKAFNLKAFPPTNPHKSYDKPQSKSASIPQCRPQTEVDYIKYVVQNWQKGTVIRTMEEGHEKDDLLHFRRSHKLGNKYIHQYTVEEIWAPGDPEPRQVLKRLEVNKENPQLVEAVRIVLSREEVFEAINEWHHHNGHLGQERTWEYCKGKFWNVTQEHVRLYCTTCFICLKKNPVTKKLKGSIKPIFSKNFRDRFQVDLIDFRRLRKRDPFGVLMRWVMTLKDHATGLTCICALPRKQAHLVAYKLQEIFGMIGYPKIFHTDNGKEFTAKCVLELLRHLNPNIISVSGRPRRPRDQGSVENVNKLVKRVLGSVLAERRLAGQNPNWTEVLGSVAAVINTQSGRGKNDVAAYEAVYGQKLDHPMSCSKAEARRCWTVKDRMLVTSDPEFETYCKENYILEDAINEVTEDDDVGYFSEDDLSLDEMNEVSDEWFESHLMDDCAIVTPAKSEKRSHNKKMKSLGEPTKKDDVPGVFPKSDVTFPMLCQSIDDRKPPPEDIVPQTQDDNGLIFGPSCVGRCFTKDADCKHEKIKVHLNDVGDYVVFPSLWWHHGYYDIKSEDKVVFTAQLFATPRSDIGSSKRSQRKNSVMTSYKQGRFDPSKLKGLSEDLFLHWDDNYSADKFPPATKFFGRIDKGKNRHILQDQIHQVPKIEQLVFAFEEEVGDITVDSVWLIKKTREDDGFQEWHQDMKHKLTKTIVVNVGTGVVSVKAKSDDEVEVISPVISKVLSNKYFYSVADAWKHLEKVNPRDMFMYCHLNCKACSPDAKFSILVGNDKFIHRYTTSQDWYQYEFICAFLALVQHSFHTELPSYLPPGNGVTMIRTPHPHAEIRESEVVVLDGMTHLVSVAFARNHFAVLLYDIEGRAVVVYDGLNYPLKTWQYHITHTLRKYGFQKWDAQPHVEITKGKDSEVLELCFDDLYVPWVVASDPILKQHDGFNCGPIACLKVMEIYGILPMNSIAEIGHQQYGYRGVVMDYYKRFLLKHDGDLQFILSKTGVKKITRNSSLGKNDWEDNVEQEADEEDKEAEDNSHTSTNRKLAMDKKNRKQEESAIKAMKKCGDAALKSGISPGAVVTLQVDYRTHYNPEGLVAIVYAVQPRTGGIKVCCQHGVITHDGGKGDYWVPADKYIVKAPVGTFLPLPDDLAQVRKMVEDGLFIEEEAKCPRISYSKMHELQINANSPIKKSKGCGCKRGKCGSNCGCKRNKHKCHSGCACNGNCGD